MEAGLIADPIIVGVSLMLFLLYHVYLVYRLRKTPLDTILGQTRAVRLGWCRSVMLERRDILAVQTIRNGLMASTFLATASLTLIAVVTAYLINAEKVVEFEKIAILSSNAISPGYKFFSILVCLMISFFCYSQSIRANNHASFLVTTPTGEGSLFLSPELVWMLLNRGALYYTVGTRVFYLACLSLIWLFGPISVLVGCVLIILVLYFTDMSPEMKYKVEEETLSRSNC